MKTMKKLASAALALVMALCLTVPAFAQEVNAGENGEGSITVTNPAPEQTYNLYRIFDLESYKPATGEQDQSTLPHAYKVNDTWKDFVTGADIKGVYVEIDDEGYVTWKDGADVEAFAKAAILWAEGAEAVLNEDGSEKTPAVEGHIATPVATAKAGTAAEPTEAEPDPRAEAITFKGLKLGYYLISSTRGALCALDTTNKAANVTEKNVKPTIDKEAVELPDGIGDSVKYEVTVHAKKGAEKYVVHDTMSKGLSFNNDVTAYVRTGTEGNYTDTPIDNTDNASYTVVIPTGDATALTDGCTFEVVFEQAYLNTLTANNTDIVISYTATVTADAVEVDTLNNTAKLSYGNETTPEETLPDPVDIPLYQFDLVKTTSNGTKLDGAEFELYDALTGGNKIALVKETVNTAEDGQDPIYVTYYRPATDEEKNVESFVSAIIDAEDGMATIKGLGAGTYYLEETKQPEGYNKLKGRQEVVLNGNLKASDTPTVEQVDGKDVSKWGGVQVYNYTGAELPETGGIGTTIFYIVGGLLAVGAGVLLVTKKKMGADEE